MSKHRTDLSKAGWLHIHPNLKAGFPSEWKPTTYGGVGYVCAIMDCSELDDTDACVNLCIEPMMAVDDTLIKHIVISNHPDYVEWLLFYNNKFIGLINQGIDDSHCVELIDASIWSEILTSSGFSHGSITTQAPYDPKIYLTTELYNFVKDIQEEYDPYL